MDLETKRALLKKLSEASTTEGPISIKHQGKSLAVILPVIDYEQFDAEQSERLKNLEKELGGILSLIRSNTQQQTLAEVEARLARLRQEIEEEMAENS